jgi:hypothetical protein
LVGHVNCTVETTIADATRKLEAKAAAEAIVFVGETAQVSRVFAVSRFPVCHAMTGTGMLTQAAPTFELVALGLVWVAGLFAWLNRRNRQTKARAHLTTPFVALAPLPVVAPPKIEQPTDVAAQNAPVTEVTARQTPHTQMQRLQSIVEKSLDRAEAMSTTQAAAHTQLAAAEVALDRLMVEMRGIQPKPEPTPATTSVAPPAGGISSARPANSVVLPKAA